MPKDKKPLKKKITIKQKKFAAELIKTSNATQAAKNAGYSKKTARQIGSQNLTKVVIQEEIKTAAQELGIDAKYVLRTIKTSIDRSMQSSPVTNQKGEQVFCENADGDIVPAYRFDATSVLRGTELLGKHLNLFTESSKLEVDIKSDDNSLTEAARAILFLAAKSQSK